MEYVLSHHSFNSMGVHQLHVVIIVVSKKTSTTNLQAIALDFFFIVVVGALFFKMLFKIFLFQLLSALHGATYINKVTLFQMILKEGRATEYV